MEHLAQYLSTPVSLPLRSTLVARQAIYTLLRFIPHVFIRTWSFHLVSTVQADFLAGVVVFTLRAPLRRLAGSVPLILGCATLWYTRAHDFAFAVPLSMAAILVGMVNLRLP